MGALVRGWKGDKRLLEGTKEGRALLGLTPRLQGTGLGLSPVARVGGLRGGLLVGLG